MKRKQWIIGSVIGAVIVFVWQSLSWMALGIHDSQMKYTPAQSEILNVLSSGITEEGLYSIPSAPTQQERQAVMKEMEGKPWASVIFHKSYKGDMTMRLIRGFLVDLFMTISLIYILTRGASIPIARRVFAGSVAFGLAIFLGGQYMGHIWFDLPWHMITGDLIDDVASWSLCGIWLGWFLNKK